MAWPALFITFAVGGPTLAHVVGPAVLAVPGFGLTHLVLYGSSKRNWRIRKHYAAWILPLTVVAAVTGAALAV